MTKREELQDQYKLNNKKIAELKIANTEIWREQILLSDDKQQFIEKIEIANYKEGRKVIKTERLIGRIHWVEYFEDMDTNTKIPINRSRMVRLDGEFI